MYSVETCFTPRLLQKTYKVVFTKLIMDI